MFDTRIDDLLEVAQGFTYEAPREEQPWEQRGAGESGFDPVELWVMGPPCGSKVGRTETSCVIMQERHVKG